MTIKIAHDYICPWCWIARHQTARLIEELGVEFDWVGYELMPEELPWGEPKPEEPAPADKAVTPSRLVLAYYASNTPKPSAHVPKRMRSHNALEATEYAKSVGVGQAFVERLYDALWREGQVINEPDVLATLAVGIVPDVQEMLAAVAEKRYDEKIVKFDDDAYADGVYNVPTFYIGNRKFAEQPYEVLRQAISRLK